MSATNPLSARLRAWLALAVEAGASDLHVIAGYPPVLRQHGDLTELPEPPLTGAEAQALLEPLCPPGARARFEAQKNVDFSFDLEVSGGVNRFRANLFRAGGQLCACLRVVPSAIPKFAWAGFPLPLGQRLAAARDGLVIVTGATGS